MFLGLKQMLALLKLRATVRSPELWIVQRSHNFFSPKLYKNMTVNQSSSLNNIQKICMHACRERVSCCTCVSVRVCVDMHLCLCEFGVQTAVALVIHPGSQGSRLPTSWCMRSRWSGVAATTAQPYLITNKRVVPSVRYQAFSAKQTVIPASQTLALLPPSLRGASYIEIQHSGCNPASPLYPTTHTYVQPKQTPCWPGPIALAWERNVSACREELLFFLFSGEGNINVQGATSLLVELKTAAIKCLSPPENKTLVVAQQAARPSGGSSQWKAIIIDGVAVKNKDTTACQIRAS